MQKDCLKVSTKPIHKKKWVKKVIPVIRVEEVSGSKKEEGRIQATQEAPQITQGKGKNILAVEEDVLQDMQGGKRRKVTGPLKREDENGNDKEDKERSWKIQPSFSTDNEAWDVGPSHQAKGTPSPTLVQDTFVLTVPPIKDQPLLSETKKSRF